MEVPGGTELLRALFAKAPPGYTVEVRHVPGGAEAVPCDNPVLPDDLGHGQWYFGACPRGHNGVVDVGTSVWADFDGNAPDQPYPVPTATVRSGKEGGLHAYWVLATPAPVSVVIRLTKLAALAQESDPAVCEPKRVMRLPGSYNTKYSAPPLCVVASLSPKVTYGPDELEEYLVALLLSRYWDEGLRHGLAMAGAATLARAGWPEERVEAAVRAVCERTGDTEVHDRVTAAVHTVRRKEAGTLVSAADLREAMQEQYKRLLEALGITARDGDLVHSDVKVGHVLTMERDLVEWLLAEEEWAYADGRVHRWAGTHWKPAGPEELLSGVFTATAQLKAVTSGLEQDFNATAKLAAALTRVMTGRLMQQELADPEPTHLPLSNGVLDLSSGGLLPHGKEIRNRWLLDVAYDPTATCPTWLKFLSEAVTEEEAGLLQEWVGYCLVAGNDFQRMLWLYGPTSTGKSTFLNALSGLLGQSVAAVTSGTFTEYTVAELVGKRVALCSEISNRTLKTTTLKALVSSDVVQGRHPYGRPFPARFTGKIVWASNSLPPVDQGEGVWRRLFLVPFVKTPTQVDEKLGEKIRAELPGVLLWALEGLGRVKKYREANKWPEPGSVVQLVAEYREGADPWAQFAEDVLVVDPEQFVELGELYQAYAAWAKEHGYVPEPAGSIFRQELKRIGGAPDDKPRKVGKKMLRCWSGLALKTNTFLSQDDD